MTWRRSAPSSPSSTVNTRRITRSTSSTPPTTAAFGFGRPGRSVLPKPTSPARPPAGRLRREVIQENLSTTYPEGGARDRTFGIGERGNPGGGSAPPATPAGPAGRAAPADGSSAWPIGGTEPRRRRHSPRG